jgi:hypothetical protein
MGIDSLGSMLLLEIKFGRIEKGEKQVRAKQVKNQGFLKLVLILSFSSLLSSILSYFG